MAMASSVTDGVSVVFVVGCCCLVGVLSAPFGTQLPMASITVSTGAQAIGDTWGVTSNVPADSRDYWPEKMLNSSVPDGLSYFMASGDDPKEICQLSIDLLTERNITSVLFFPMGKVPGSYSIVEVNATAVNGMTGYTLSALPEWTNGSNSNITTPIEVFVNRKIRHMTVSLQKPALEMSFYMGRIHFYTCPPCNYEYMMNSATCKCIPLPQCDRYVYPMEVNQWSASIVASQSGFFAPDTLTVTFSKPIVNGEGPISILSRGETNVGCGCPSSACTMTVSGCDIIYSYTVNWQYFVNNCGAHGLMSDSAVLYYKVIFNYNFDTYIVNSSVVQATIEATPLYIAIPTVIDVMLVQINLIDPYVPTAVAGYVTVKRIVDRKLHLEFYTATLSPYDIFLYVIEPSHMFFNQTLTHVGTPCTVFDTTCYEYWHIDSYLSADVCIFQGEPLLVPFQFSCLTGAYCSYMVGDVDKQNGTFSIPLWSGDLCGTVQVNATLTGTFDMFSDSDCSKPSTSFSLVPPTYAISLIDLTSSTSIDHINLINFFVFVNDSLHALIFDMVSQPAAVTSLFQQTTPYYSDATKMHLSLQFNTDWLSLEMGQSADIKFQADLTVEYKETTARQGNTNSLRHHDDIENYPRSLSVVAHSVVSWSADDQASYSSHASSLEPAYNSQTTSPSVMQSSVAAMVYPVWFVSIVLLVAVSLCHL
ncbi:hypothetical protein Pelo_13189 [Pelomyxa schiedti]|nr:hypothetical protein Pelo_13189 [Pelomyxa schiedti]